jgi:glyoxylase-like metal-dependent hydrolase (beta-lactamase superfamily II)
MPPALVPGCEAIYRLDVPMFGTTAVNSPYLVDGPEPTLIDTGTADGVDAVLDGFETLDLDPADVAYLVPTHAHLDHAGGLGPLAEACEHATVVCHANAVEYLTDPERLDHLAASVERALGMPDPYGEPTPVDRDRCLVVDGGETLALGDRTLEFVDAPGHAPHQFCVYDHRTAVLFAADANGMHFAESGQRPTTPPPDFDLETALDTVDRLREFEPETVLYPHFGWGEPGAGVAELRAYAALLPEFVDAVAAARETHGDDVQAIAGELSEEWGHWSLETDVAGVVHALGS